MRLEVIQYALKCKEELDVILGAIDKIKLMLFDNQLDEMYAETLLELEHLRLSAHRATENLSNALEDFLNG